MSASMSLASDGTLTITGEPTAAVILTTGIKLLSGTGSPNNAITAPQGSIYFRQDGGVARRYVYVNTDGGTSWAALTTSI